MKNNNTKSIVLLITCILMVCLMGCSNATSQPEEVEEPVATDEPVEVISIKEHADLTNYIATLDPDQPEIIIYNKLLLNKNQVN